MAMDARRGISPQALGIDRQFSVVVLTGFLGSGKTTLLNRLLHHPSTSNTAVIVNELGEVGLDHLLVHSPVDETVLLDNGCLCCTLRGDLSATLQELVARRVTGEIPPFERVVIETTGIADPVPMVQTLVEDEDVKPFFRLDGIVSVVDALNAEQQLEHHFQSVKQVAVADRVLLTKPDLVNDATLERLTGRVNALNPGVAVDVVMHGEIDPAQILGNESGLRAGRGADVETWLGESACEAIARARAASNVCDHSSDHGDHREHGEHGDRGGHGDHPHHHHGDSILTFSIRRAIRVHPAGLKLWLDLLSVYQGPSLLRVKGILNVEGRPVLINVVQHACHPPRTLDEWPDDDRSSRIVFITHGLERGTLEATLEALTFVPADRSGERLIDRGDYRRFTGIVERFRGAGPS